MGVHLYVYAGWCFKVPTVKQERIKVKQACVNEACSAHNVECRAKFCQECGQSIGKIESSSIVEEQLRLSDVDEKWEDLMMEAGPESGEQYWIPNYHDCGQTFGKYEDNESLVLQDVDMEATAERFGTQHREFREAIEKEHNVQLRAVYAIVAYEN